MRAGRLCAMTHEQSVATACDGKKRLGAALAEKLARRAHDGRGAYRCKHCGWFHIGNSVRPASHRSRKNASHSRRSRHHQEE
jgi:hypothetical protein